MIVKVTQEHIDKGLKESSQYCPIALSLNDMGFKDADVKNTRVYIERQFYVLPDKAFRFVRNFDVGLPVEPFEFEIKE